MRFISLAILASAVCVLAMPVAEADYTLAAEAAAAEQDKFVTLVKPDAAESTDDVLPKRAISPMLNCKRCAGGVDGGSVGLDGGSGY